MSELIHTKVKGLASGLVTSFNFICMFVISLEFQAIADLIQFQFIYLAFALISFSSLLFVYYFLPESKVCIIFEIRVLELKKRTNRLIEFHFYFNLFKG